MSLQAVSLSQIPEMCKYSSSLWGGDSADSVSVTENERTHDSKEVQLKNNSKRNNFNLLRNPGSVHWQRKWDCFCKTKTLPKCLQLVVYSAPKHNICLIPFNVVTYSKKKFSCFMILQNWIKVDLMWLFSTLINRKRQLSFWGRPDLGWFTAGSYSFHFLMGDSSVLQGMFSDLVHVPIPRLVLFNLNGAGFATILTQQMLDLPNAGVFILQYNQLNLLNYTRTIFI